MDAHDQPIASSNCIVMEMMSQSDMNEPVKIDAFRGPDA
jgi:hypothetical protein